MSSGQIIKIGRLYEKEINYGISLTSLATIEGSISLGETTLGVSLPKPKVAVDAGKSVVNKYRVKRNGIVDTLECIGGAPPFGVKLRLHGATAPSIDVILHKPSTLDYYIRTDNKIISMNCRFKHETKEEYVDITPYSIAEFIPVEDEVFCSPADMIKLYDSGTSEFTMGAFPFYGIYEPVGSDVVFKFIHYPPGFTGFVNNDTVFVKLADEENVREVRISNSQASTGTSILSQTTSIVPLDGDPAIPLQLIYGAFYSIDRVDVTPITPIIPTSVLISDYLGYNPPVNYDTLNYGKIDSIINKHISVAIFIDDIITVDDTLTFYKQDWSSPIEVTVTQIVSSGIFAGGYGPKEFVIKESITADYAFWKFGKIDQPAIDLKIFLLSSPVKSDSLSLKFFNYLGIVNPEGFFPYRRNLVDPVIGETINLKIAYFTDTTDVLVSADATTIGILDTYIPTFSSNTVYQNTLVYRTPITGISPLFNYSLSLPPGYTNLIRFNMISNYEIEKTIGPLPGMGAYLNLFKSDGEFLQTVQVKTIGSDNDNEGSRIYEYHEPLIDINAEIAQAVLVSPPDLSKWNSHTYMYKGYSRYGRLRPTGEGGYQVSKVFNPASLNNEISVGNVLYCVVDDDRDNIIEAKVATLTPDTDYSCSVTFEQDPGLEGYVYFWIDPPVDIYTLSSDVFNAITYNPPPGYDAAHGGRIIGASPNRQIATFFSQVQPGDEIDLFNTEGVKLTRVTLSSLTIETYNLTFGYGYILDTVPVAPEEAKYFKVVGYEEKPFSLRTVQVPDIKSNDIRLQYFNFFAQYNITSLSPSSNNVFHVIPHASLAIGDKVEISELDFSNVREATITEIVYSSTTPSLISKVQIDIPHDDVVYIFRRNGGVSVGGGGGGGGSIDIIRSFRARQVQWVW